MTATDPSGLLAATIYYFKVNSVEYHIVTGAAAPEYQEVADLMDAALDGHGFSTVIAGVGSLGDIRVIHEAERGWDSEIELGFGTSGNNLWTNLNGFTNFDPAVPGRGAFSIIIDSSNKASGEVITGGSATYSHIDEPPVGSIILSGTAEPHVVNVIPPAITGGIVSDGIGFYQIGYIYYPEIYDSGDTALYGNDIYLDGTYSSATGETGSGMILRGSAEYEFEVSYHPTGKILLTGTSINTVEYAHESSGLITLTGTSPIDEFAIERTGDGTATTDGVGFYEFNVEFSWMSSGSIIITGAAEIENSFIYEAELYGDNYYPFNERTGTTVNDQLGSNDLTIDNANGWTNDSKFIAAQRFNKVDYSTLSTDINPLAISFWHKRNTTDQDSYRVLGASSDDEHWYFAYEPTYFRALIRNGANYYYFFNGIDCLLIPDDDEYHWYYIDFFSGSNAIVYVDNVYRGTTVNFFGTAANQLHTVGNGGDPGTTGFGLIDDLRVYTSIRLTEYQREIVFTLSPVPGSMILGGSAVIQIVQDSTTPAEVIYELTPTGGIKFSGQILSYIAKNGFSFSGSALASMEFESEASGGIVLQSISTYHDFGLGYVYSTDGTTITTGTSNYESVANYEYQGSGGIELTSKSLIVIVIIGSFWLILQETASIKLSGNIIFELQDLVAETSGGIIIGGSAVYQFEDVINLAPWPVTGPTSPFGYIKVHEADPTIQLEVNDSTDPADFDPNGDSITFEITNLTTLNSTPTNDQYILDNTQITNAGLLSTVWDDLLVDINASFTITTNDAEFTTPPDKLVVILWKP